MCFSGDNGLHGGSAARQHTGAAGQIARHPHVRESGGASQCGRLVQMPLVQLEGEGAARLERAGAPRQQATQHVQAVGPAVEREVGTYGGFDTTRSSRPIALAGTPWPKSHCTTRTRSDRPRASTFSRASATASGAMSVAMTRVRGCS